MSPRRCLCFAAFMSIFTCSLVEFIRCGQPWLLLLPVLVALPLYALGTSTHQGGPPWDSV